MNRYRIIFILFFSFLLLTEKVLFSQQTQDYIYVGEKVCRQCHHLNGNRNQFNQWRLTHHAKAYAVLGNLESKQIAELSGIDTEPQKSPVCLGCHTTAYSVEKWEKDESFYLEDGVQCELCHGPGSDYIDENIMMDRKKALKAGLILGEERDCLVCHKEKASHITVLNSKKFNYKEALQEIAHYGREGKLHIKEKPHSKISISSKYVGAFSCASCHGKDSNNKIFSKWRLSKHSQAYVELSSQKALDIAKRMGVSGNPQQEGKCLACHTTGTAESESQFGESFNLVQGVQCESCHGSGSEYMADAVMRDPVAAAEAGLLKVTEQSCVKCHIDGIHGHTFDYDRMLPMVNHSKWREEFAELEYKTPFNLAITNDGKLLFVAYGFNKISYSSMFSKIISLNRLSFGFNISAIVFIKIPDPEL